MADKDKKKDKKFLRPDYAVIEPVDIFDEVDYQKDKKEYEKHKNKRDKQKSLFKNIMKSISGDDE